MKKFCVLLILMSSYLLQAQNVGIGITTPAFKLDVKDGSINTDSIYRITGFQVLSIKGSQNLFIGQEAGRVNTAGSNSFAGYRSGYNNLGGAFNTFFGTSTGVSNTTGNNNSIFGSGAGIAMTIAEENSMFGSAAGAITTGGFNSFFGAAAGASNTTGEGNSFFGRAAGALNQTGINNSIFGVNAGYSTSSGNNNVFFGPAAGFDNNSGHSNVAIGARTLFNNVSQSNLVAVGDSALYNNNSGASLTAIGSKALLSNSSGSGNTGVGRNVLYNNVTGFDNTGMGRDVMFLTTGAFNTAIGTNALYQNSSGNSNTAIGLEALLGNSTGSFNSALGASAGVGAGNLTNATALGARAYVSNSNAMVLGSINGVNGALASTRVGIGLSEPLYPLDVKTITQTPARFSGNSGIGGMYLSFYENDVYRGYMGSYSGNAEDMDIGTGAGNITGKLHLTIQATPHLTIDNAGRAGLGTTSPDPNSKLHVTTGGLQAGYFTSSNIGNTSSIIKTEATGPLDFVATGITIDQLVTDGRGRGLNVFAGYIGAEINSQDVTGASQNYGIISRTNSDGDAWAVFATTQGGLGGTKIGVYSSPTGGLTNWAFYGVGNAFLSGGTWQTSDERFKMNIGAIDNASGRLRKLSARTYYFNSTGYEFMNLPAEQQYGFLASDMEKIFPSLVKELEQFKTRPEPGQAAEKIKFKAVNYTGLIPVIVQALNEQTGEQEKSRKENEELKKMIQAQQKSIGELQKQIADLRKLVDSR